MQLDREARNRVREVLARTIIEMEDCLGIVDDMFAPYANIVRTASEVKDTDDIAYMHAIVAGLQRESVLPYTIATEH